MRYSNSYLLPAALLFTGFAAAEVKTIPLTSTDGLKFHGASAEAVTYEGRKGLRASQKEGAGEQSLIIAAAGFHNGTIEIDVSGRPGASAVQAARGFVGVAFRVADDFSKFECFYLRPTNGRADDQVRRNHSVQYISFPGFPWEKLRKEEPEKYESYADLVPGEWTKVKITVDGVKARLYVKDAGQPALIVNDLKQGDSRGAVGLWIGPGTEAHFANLKITQ
jgi:hypothetical protein